LRAKLLAYKRLRRHHNNRPHHQSRLTSSLKGKINSHNSTMNGPTKTIDDLRQQLGHAEKRLQASEKKAAAAVEQIKDAADRACDMSDQALFMNREIERQNMQLVSQRETITRQLAMINSLQDKLGNRGPSPFLSLPAEIRELVVAQVSPEDCFFLAQTCQTMRALAYYGWKGKVEWPTGEKKHSFLLAVALRLDDAWVCLHCRKIHFANVRYMPGTTLYFQKACNITLAADYRTFGTGEFNDKDNDEDDNENSHDEEDQDEENDKNWGKVWKALEHREIQMALKYTLRGEKHKAQPFLRAYTHSESAVPFMKEKQGTMHFYFQPKIIDGHYIAYAEYNLQVTQTRLIYMSDLNSPIWLGLCRHEYHEHTSDEEFLILDMALYLIGNRGVEKTSSCVYCPSDFAYISQGDRYQIRTWRYFGQYDRDVVAFSMQSGCMGTRGHFGLEPHVPGSIRKMWEDAD
jgi:hypothetical protein